MSHASLPARPDLRPVLWAALLAGALAALVNGGLFLLTQRAFEGVVAGPGQRPFTVLPVVGLSLLGALAAGLVYALLTRLTRQPGRVFTIVAVTVLLASLGTPLTLRGAPTEVVLILNLMHVVVFALVLALVPRRSEGRGR